MILSSHRPRLFAFPVALTGLVVTLAGLFAGCRSTASPKQIYDAMIQDYSSSDGIGGLSQDVAERQDERFARVVELFDAGELDSATDNFWGAAVLVRSDDPAHLVLAESLAAHAADLGDRRGRIVVAEALDRQALIAGTPQPYGTQYLYVPVLGRWQIYEVDPRTTDADRRAMGLPTLAELQARVERLSDDDVTGRLRGQFEDSAGRR